MFSSSMDFTSGDVCVAYSFKDYSRRPEPLHRKKDVRVSRARPCKKSGMHGRRLNTALRAAPSAGKIWLAAAIARFLRRLVSGADFRIALDNFESRVRFERRRKTFNLSASNNPRREFPPRQGTKELCRRDKLFRCPTRRHEWMTA